jgi:hypothetical protein
VVAPGRLGGILPGGVMALCVPTVTTAAGALIAAATGHTLIAATLLQATGWVLWLTAGLTLSTAEPEPDRAIALGLRSAAAAGVTGSARIGQELRTLGGVLTRRWPAMSGRQDHEAVAALR